MRHSLESLGEEERYSAVKITLQPIETMGTVRREAEEEWRSVRRR
jgi:hypothetical protein